ncbi:DUF4350 domain-containing protein [Duganella sp. Root336D2]|uniref:DUF4350 domain-containing protein n=1 Tax=Duganella sp. Root336D2 TaxID=1736518 RepID=UPI0006F20A8C|nr:DUF4350 domain-containing protein [Duganella sp. Root336D2]KQV44913.1 hypothetical protein ASD07_20445 [Duganella sp. Root336D2]
MKRSHTIIIAIVAVLLAGAGYELWHLYFHKVWRGQYHVSEAQAKNPMLAATRLLEASGHKVRVEPVLSYQLLNQLPDGVLLLSRYARPPDERQARLLLDWVRRGNTLVMTPDWVGDTEEGEASPADLDQATDPLGKHFGVAMSGRSRVDDSCRIDPLETSRREKRAAKAKAGQAQNNDGDDGEEGDDGDDGDGAAGKEAEGPARLVCLNAPGAANTIELARPSDTLQRFQGKGPAPLWGDTYELAVLVYGEGRGKVAMVAVDAGDSYFDNDALRQFDHAELLLLLAGQSGPHAPVMLVQHNEPVGWAAWLWQHGRPVVLGLAALLLLWTWSASRRFGPMLPEAPTARRALIEHIEASGRWLWRLPQGRALLLEAVRKSTEKQLLRRLPELHALGPAERARRLARLAKMPEPQVSDALLGAPAKRAADFTRQISILQQLRAHHER